MADRGYPLDRVKAHREKTYSGYRNRVKAHREKTYSGYRNLVRPCLSCEPGRASRTVKESTIAALAATDGRFEDQNWRAQALCARSDPDLWFAPGAVEHKTAKRVCRDCPVRMQCLAYAMETPVDHGVWGGFTERERRRARRRAGHGDWRLQLAC